MKGTIDKLKESFNGLNNYQKIINILGICYLTALLFIEAKGKGDIDIYLSASRDFFAGKNIYKVLYHEQFHYFYDIIFAILIAPLRIFNLYWAGFIWLAINYLLTFRIWRIISSYLPKNSLSKQNLNLLFILSLIFVFSVWHKNIRYGQVTIFILYLCTEGIYQIQKKNAITGSVLIALGISVKILPIVLIPYLLYRKYFKECLYIPVLVVLVGWIVPGLFFGFEQVGMLLNERWLLINPTNSEHILDVQERSFHSLTTLLSVLFYEGAGNEYSLELKRNIAHVNLQTLSTIINAIRAFFILLVIYFIRSMPFKKPSSSLQSLYEISYIFLIVPLIFPHQQHYAFFFAFPCSVYLMYFVMNYYFSKNRQADKKSKILIISLLSIQFLFLNSHYLLGNFVNYYDHYKTLTYGILSLIPLLAFAKPGKICANK